MKLLRSFPKNYCMLIFWKLLHGVTTSSSTPGQGLLETRNGFECRLCLGCWFRVWQPPPNPSSIDTATATTNINKYATMINSFYHQASSSQLASSIVPAKWGHILITRSYFNGLREWPFRWAKYGFILVINHRSMG